MTIVLKCTLKLRKSVKKKGRELSCNRIAYVNSISFRLSIGFVSFHYRRCLQYQQIELFYAVARKITFYCIRTSWHCCLLVKRVPQKCNEIKSEMSNFTIIHVRPAALSFNRCVSELSMQYRMIIIWIAKHIRPYSTVPKFLLDRKSKKL